MKLRFWCAAFVLALLFPRVTLARSTPAFASALPTGARLGLHVVVNGSASDFAVTYSLAGWNIGVVSTHGKKSVLEWHRSVAGAPTSIDSPSSGVFRVVTRLPRNTGEAIYADILEGGAVVSTLPGNLSRLMAQEGVVLHPAGFALRSIDASHVGGVRYRTVRSYTWRINAYFLQSVTHRPDYSQPAYPRPSGWVRTASGDIALLRLEVADTPEKLATGLMNRSKLDPDSGMLFVWQGLTEASFWMKDTLIPLSIAWLAPDGTIQEIQDMQAQTTNLHTPAMPYNYAVEANLGYFTKWGIKPGDRLHLLGT